MIAGALGSATSVNTLATEESTTSKCSDPVRWNPNGIVKWPCHLKMERCPTPEITRSSLSPAQHTIAVRQLKVLSPTHLVVLLGHSIHGWYRMSSHATFSRNHIKRQLTLKSHTYTYIYIYHTPCFFLCPGLTRSLHRRPWALACCLASQASDSFSCTARWSWEARSSGCRAPGDPGATLGRSMLAILKWLKLILN